MDDNGSSKRGRRRNSADAAVVCASCSVERIVVTALLCGIAYGSNCSFYAVTFHSPQYTQLSVIEAVDPNELKQDEYKFAVAGKPLAQQPTVEWRLPPKGDFVLISTEVGQFVIGLYATQAPRTVEHFKKLVAFEYYVGGSFYRVECDYLIQGGGYFPEKQLRPSPVGTSTVEYMIPNTERMVAFTRPPEDVHGQDTEFFINMKDNSHHLGRDGVADGGYTVFGRVEAGWSAVKSMCDRPVKKDNKDHHMVKDPIEITGCRILSNEEKEAIEAAHPDRVELPRRRKVL